MSESVKAVVLANEGRKESDRLAWLLCDFGEILRVYVRGARNGKNKLSAASEPFVAGSFELSRTSGGFVLDDAEITEQFFSLRGDLKNYALAGYFAQLIRLLFTEDAHPELYPLFANSLYLLANHRREPETLKAVFEWRIAALAGFCPAVAVCADCGGEDVRAFSVEAGTGYCAACAERHPNAVTLGEAGIRAIRTACGSDLRKAFGFTVTGEGAAALYAAAQAHLLYRLEEIPATLQYYQSLTDFEKQLAVKE